MDNEATRAAVLELHEAFRQGDYERLVKLYHDDVDWVFYAPRAIFPHVGVRHGKVAAFQTLTAINELFRFTRHVTELVIADGERAAALADCTLVQRATGRIIRCRVVSFYRFRDGRVIEYRGFTDSFDVAEQVLGRHIDV